MPICKYCLKEILETNPHIWDSGTYHKSCYTLKQIKEIIDSDIEASVKIIKIEELIN